jgi:single-stranded-DNA-specific exonuclease
MAKWLIEKSTENLPSFLLSAHPLVVRILFFRGLKTKQEIANFISPDYETESHNPFLFRDMEKVIERIKTAADKKEKVAIFGDYDADGITASLLIKEALNALNVESYVYIPDKHKEGYGINSLALKQFKEKMVTLIITVDCGIKNITEIEEANAMGMDVIVTDHHYVPDVLPPAYAIINPHKKNCSYPFKDLAGVGVAFKVVQAIYQRLLHEKLEQTKWLLDLVAIGTVADCVPLTGENRVFVKYGLVVLSKTRRVGLKELFSVGRMVIDEKNIPDAKKIAFYIAPRINAASRIKHADMAYNLIAEKDIVRARELALELEKNNTERQKITETVTNEIKLLAQNSFKNKSFIFAIGEHFPVGVVGLVAGKIAQQFNKPAAVFQKSENVSKGSFRSIPQLNIIETIEECQEFLEKFGGHSQAAGASIKNENVERFYEKMDLLISQKLAGMDFSEEIKVDVEAACADIDFDLASDLEKLRPFGEGNAEPVFLIRNLIVREKRILGNGNKHIKLFLTAAGESPKIFEAISFNGYEKFFDVAEGDNVDILCNIQKDEWNGNQKIQLVLIDLKIVK